MSLELLSCRPHIQFMRPQIHGLLAQPQIRPPYAFCAHSLTLQLLLSRGCRHILDTSICDGMDDLNALWTEFSCQGLSELPYRRAACAIGCELSVASQCTKCACEDESAFLASTFTQWCGSVIGLEAFQGLLCE